MWTAGTAVTEGASSLILPAPAVAEYWYPGVLTCYVVLTLVCLVGNLMTVVAYYLTPGMHNPHHLLICQLSIVDLVVAATATPFIFLNYTQAGMVLSSSNKYLCLTCLWMIAASANMSLMVIFFISLERFIAINFPYRYYTVVTERTVKLAMAGSCAFSVSTTAVPLLVATGWQPDTPCSSMHVHPAEYNIFINITRTVIMIAIAVLNICVARIALIKKQIQVNPVCHPRTLSPTLDYKVTKMLLAVVGVFYVCWIPYVILAAVLRLKQNPPEYFVICHDYSKMLVGVNSCLNPLIYAKRNRHFREAFKRILVRLRLSTHAPSSSDQKACKSISGQMILKHGSKLNCIAN